MDEQGQAVIVPRRRNRAQAEQLAVEYEGSGLSRVEFCRQHGLSLVTLARYRKRRAQGQTATGSRWLAVEAAGSSATSESRGRSGLAVALSGGRRIEVGCGFDAHTLVELLGVLDRV